MKQYLYVLHSDSGLVKVGISGNVERRVNAIRTGGGFAISVIFTAGPFNSAARLESTIKRKLKDHNTLGEWFSCDPKIVLCLAKELSDSFVDSEDADEEAILKAQAEVIATFRKADQKILDSHFSEIEKLFQLYEQSVALNAKLAEQIEESSEVLDWYSDQLKQALFLGKIAAERSIRLENELKALKDSLLN